MSRDVWSHSGVCAPPAAPLQQGILNGLCHLINKLPVASYLGRRQRGAEEQVGMCLQETSQCWVFSVSWWDGGS